MTVVDRVHAVETGLAAALNSAGTVGWHDDARSRSRPEQITMAFKLRRATAFDASEIAKVYSASFGMLTFLPMLHTAEEYRWFIVNVILKECEVSIAENETGIVAFLALNR